MEEKPEPGVLEEIQRRWIPGHLHHHQSLDQAVQGFVHPLAVSLLKDGQIDAFFFVRASLGGPHVRLRLRVAPGAESRVIAAMQSSARHFLDLQPSTRSLDEEAIRRSNERILAADPHEIDDSVYPDNSFRVASFRPEIERYGGTSRFRPSLDFFTLSSVASLDFLSKYGDASRAAQLGHAFCLLLQQALGFAKDGTELFDLLSYGVDSWGSILPKVVEKGEKVARSQSAAFLYLFQQSLSAARSTSAENERPRTASDFLVLGAARLSALLGTADRPTRARIGGSHMHMTASRLGLSNAEEVYLSRLLILTLQEARSAGEQDLCRPGGLAESSNEALADLLSPALALLAQVPPPGS